MASAVPKLVLLVLCSYHTLVAHAGGGRSYTVLSVGSLNKSDSVCSEPKATPSSSTGFTVPLQHRHGPCSPLTTKKMPTLAEKLRRDKLRAANIQRKFSAAIGTGAGGMFQQSDATVPTTLGTSLDTLDLEYVITVGLGSPSATQTVLIDTGSDVSWVQCKPCSQCHSQADPLFDPSSSSTYFPFSCGSATCTQLGHNGNGCSSSSQCQYIVRYGDGSTTTGTYSSDTLALGPNTVRNFQFGCSNVESGFNDDQTDGLMGLGGGAQSLVSQTAGTFGSAFSYCLPPTPGSSGFLTLGAGTTSGFVMTPMLRSRQFPTFYGVRLQAIRVGGTQLNIPTSAFSAGSIMDSGTVITRLPRTAYSALSSAFRAGMKKYHRAPASGILDTYFNFKGQTSISGIPAVALVFSGGAVVDLDPNEIMLDNCLAFAGNSDDGSLGIIGNVQQRTFEVLYDVGGGAVGFRAGAC
ncbi:unnamed protein product [Urochloa decumbens]|uniref:Peptidase A1 domain-containing protein n=1 Tax=Urochloa decumbens TaxID=240449 RepID=A0ABC9DV43_9POAL